MFFKKKMISSKWVASMVEAGIDIDYYLVL